MASKKYTIHTVGQVISFITEEPPQWTENRVIFTKLSQNDITFERRNVICIDEQTVVDNTGETTTE